MYTCTSQRNPGGEHRLYKIERRVGTFYQCLCLGVKITYNPTWGYHRQYGGYQHKWCCLYVFIIGSHFRFQAKRNV